MEVIDTKSTILESKVGKTATDAGEKGKNNFDDYLPLLSDKADFVTLQNLYPDALITKQIDLSEAPLLSQFSAILIASSKLLLFGGKDVHYEITKSVQELNFESQTNQLLTDMMVKR